MESEPVTNYYLAFYQRLREEYEARWGDPGFDEQKPPAIFSNREVRHAHGEDA
jgi:hypothetical protein